MVIHSRTMHVEQSSRVSVTTGQPGCTDVGAGGTPGRGYVVSVSVTCARVLPSSDSNAMLPNVILDILTGRLLMLISHVEDS